MSCAFGGKFLKLPFLSISETHTIQDDLKSFSTALILFIVLKNQRCSVSARLVPAVECKLYSINLNIKIFENEKKSVNNSTLLYFINWNNFSEKNFVQKKIRKSNKLNFQIRIIDDELCSVANFTPFTTNVMSMSTATDRQNRSLYGSVCLCFGNDCLSHTFMHSELYRLRPLTQRLYSNRIVGTNISLTNKPNRKILCCFLFWHEIIRSFWKFWIQSIVISLSEL